jgi:hypothetical protein
VTRTGGYGILSREVAVFLSVRELRIVRAALLASLDGNSNEWESLSDADRDIASDLLDALPVFATTILDETDDDGDDDYDVDED